MDRRKMDAEGSSVVHREWRATKLAVVVIVQNLLVAACLLVTLYVYWSVQSELQEQESVVNVHIRFGPITTISGNATLRFPSTNSKRMMSVAGENNDTIHINCTGPYILDVDLCYKSLGNEESTGVLQLLRSESPASSFDLRASTEVCRGLHNITYLWAADQVTLRLYSKDDFKIMRATVGLSYLLGSQCESRPVNRPSRNRQS